MKHRFLSLFVRPRSGGIAFAWAILLAVASSATPRSIGADTTTTNAPSAAVTRGIQLFQQHRFRSAEGFLQDALKNNPTNLDALIYLGRIAFEENRLEDAIPYFEKATEAAPHDSAAFHWLGRAEGVHARDLGVPRGMMPARAAKRALEKAVSLDPNNLEARVDLITFYKEAPGIVGGSKRSAFKEAADLARRDPYLGALVQGDLYLSEKRFAQAEEQYRAATQLQPNRAESYFRIGIAYQQNGRYSDAFTAFEKTLQLDPGYKSALFQLGKTADLSGERLDEGERALKSYLECRPFYIMPKLSWAHRRLGDIYLKTGRTDAARQEYMAALNVDPDDKEARAALRDLGPSHTSHR